MRYPIVNGNIVTPTPFKFIKLPGVSIHRWVWAYRQSFGWGIIHNDYDDTTELRARVGWVGFIAEIRSRRIYITLVQLISHNRGTK
jgi:hypothetical protein